MTRNVLKASVTEAIPMQKRNHLFLSAAAAVLLLLTAARAAAQPITANPQSLAFFAQVGGNPPGQQTIAVSGAAGSTITVSATTTGGGNWIFVSPITQTSPFTLTVFALTSGLQAGNYSGTITLTSNAGGVTPLNIPVTLTMSTSPLLAASPAQLQFQFALNGTAPPAQTISLNSTSLTSLNYTAGVSTSTGNWLNVAPLQGSTPGQLAVSVTPAGLPVGSYTGAVTIVSSGAGNSPLTIPVTLTVSPEASLSASPSSLSFTHQVGTAPPRPAAVTISSSGLPINFTATVNIQGGGTWLTVTPSGTTPATISAQTNPAGLQPGDYTATITITGPGAVNSPLTIPVTLKVSLDPVLQVSPSSVSFQYQSGGSLPPPEAVVLSNLGNPLALAVSVATQTGGNWLKATPTTSTTPAALLIEAAPSALAAGTYQGTVTVAATGAANTPQTIPVTLTVSGSPMIRLSASNLTFVGQAGQSNPQPKTVRVNSTGSALGFNVSTATAVGGNWLSASPATGTTGNDITVSVNTANLISGVYSGTITVTPSEQGAAPQTIAVTLEVNINPLLEVPREPLRFSFATGGQQPANQSIQVNATSGSFAYAAAAATMTGGNWLVVGPANNTTGQPTAVGVNTLLPDGQYSGLVTISAAGVGNSPQYVPVIFSVSTVNSLRVEPGPLRFTQNFGASAPPPQALTVTSTGTLLNVSATVNTLTGGNWLSVTPAGGLTPATLNVAANGSQLPVGVYTGSVVITAAGANNSPLIVPITLEVTRPQNPLASAPASLTFTAPAGGPAPAPQTITINSPTSAGFTVTTTTASGGTWLSASPGSGNTPATITVSVNILNLPAGTYTGAVRLTSSGATNSPFDIPVTLTISAPALNLTFFQNGASFQPTAAAPGLIVTLRGSGIGPATGAGFQLTPQGTVPTTVGETRVLFDGIPAPVLYASATQVNAVVPYEIAGRFNTRVEAEYRGVRSNQLDIRVVDTAPGLFTQGNGTGQGAIVNQDGTVNGAGNPAARGSVVLLYATGEGSTSPPGITGSVPRQESELKRPLAQVRVRIGGQEVTPLYAGSAPFFVSGCMQINVPVPENIAPGNAVPVELIIGGVSSGTAVTMAVR